MVFRTFRRFWPLARQDRRLLIAGGLLAIFAAGCEVVAVYVFGVITDQALAEKSLAAFWDPAALWLGAAIVGAIASFVGDYYTELAGERFLFRLRNDVFRHVQKLPLDFFDNNKLGDLITRLTDDVEAVEALVASGAVRFTTAVVTVVTFAVAAFVVRWELALVACGLVPLFWLVLRGFTGRVQAAAVDERAGNGVIAGVVEESLSNQAVVQAYNQQSAQENRLEREGRTWLKARMTEAKLGSAYAPIVQVVETICILVVLGMGVWELSRGRITLGGLLSFAAYLGYLYPPIQTLGGFVLTAAEASAAVDRIDEVTGTEPSVEDDGSEDSGWRAHGRLDVRGVSFRYPGADEPLIEQLTFGADPGQLVVLSGPSGAGKSTITKLLLRFYDPTAGQITLDGVDLRHLSLRTLRENVTLLHQDSQLFAGSVRDNIAYGRPSATPEEITRAAYAADAHDFILALPEGYDTDVGHRGRLLSGGQRQRVAIARALLRNTPILVLDEPTTGLDRASVTRIMEPLRRLMAGRTTVLITHDPHLPVSPDLVVPIKGTMATMPEPTLAGAVRAINPARFVGRARPDRTRVANTTRITAPLKPATSGRAHVHPAEVAGRAGVRPGDTVGRAGVPLRDPRLGPETTGRHAR
jgi:ATP-binding cassette, subfamily B, bacterial